MIIHRTVLLQASWSGYYVCCIMLRSSAAAAWWWSLWCEVSPIIWEISNLTIHSLSGFISCISELLLCCWWFLTWGSGFRNLSWLCFSSSQALLMFLWLNLMLKLSGSTLLAGFPIVVLHISQSSDQSILTRIGWLAGLSRLDSSRWLLPV